MHCLDNFCMVLHFQYELLGFLDHVSDKNAEDCGNCGGIKKILFGRGGRAGKKEF